jgi:carbonic anhydrase
VAPREGVLVIACSDYQADPFEIVNERFDVCVLQNFGNIVEPSDEGAASPVEVSMALSKVSDILVLGHTHCMFLERMVLGTGNAPRGSLQLEDSALTELRHLARSRWKLGTKLSNRECAEINVCLQLERLMLLPAVRHKMGAGQFSLHGAVHVGRHVRWLRPIKTATGHSLAFSKS